MSQIKLRLLGAPRIERDGAPVTIATRKPLALLAYLALADAPVTRERLMLLLWPDADTEHAQGDLRRALTTLRQTLGEDLLLSNRHTVALKGPVLWTDVVAFRALAASTGAGAAAESRLEEAAALWRDDFMSGFSLRDSDEFDIWLAREGERLRHELATVLQTLTDLYAGAGNPARAIAHARRWLELDPLREDAHRALMTLYARTGRRADALKQYQECERVLAHELGVQPLDETIDLYHTIKDRVDMGAKVPASAVQLDPPQRTGTIPFVGRDDALAEMMRAAAFTPGGASWIAVEGEPGIGKTRLLDEFAERATSEGLRIFRTRCYEGEAGLAYEPMAQLLRTALQPDSRANLPADLAPHWRAELARILPELGDSGTMSPLDAGARARLFESVRQTALALRGNAPLLLVFDDLQWADPSTIELLIYLLRRGAGTQLGFVTSWRNEDNDSTAKLRQLLAAIRRERGAIHIELGRLSVAHVARICESGERQIDPKRLYAESEGVPLLVVEYLHALAQPQMRNADWALPGQVRSLLLARVATLSPVQRQVLQTAAVIGRSFDAALTQRASGRSDDEVAQALEALGACGLVRTALDGEGNAFDFVHDKLREAVYDDTHLARRRLLHLRVGQLIVADAAARRAGEAAGKAARHFALADRHEDAAGCYAEAGDFARRKSANPEALAMYRAALEHGHADALRLREAMGDLLALRGDYAQAIESYRAAEADGDRADKARIAQALANAHTRLGDWADAAMCFENAMRGVDTDAQRAELLSDWSRMALARGDAAAAQTLATRANVLADSAGEAGPLARAQNMLGVLARRSGDFALAMACFERCLALADKLSDRTIRTAVLNNLALTERDAGNIDSALTLTREALRVCEAYGERHAEAALRSNLADLLRAQGSREAAMAQLTQSALIFSEIGIDVDGLRPEVWRLIEW